MITCNLKIYIFKKTKNGYDIDGDAPRVVPDTSSHSSGQNGNCSAVRDIVGAAVIRGPIRWRVWRSQHGWWEGSSSEVALYSPNRAGVRLGVMGASSFRPGVQIFTALNQKIAEIHYQWCQRDSGSSIHTSPLRGEQSWLEMKVSRSWRWTMKWRDRGLKKQRGVSVKSAGK